MPAKRVDPRQHAAGSFQSLQKAEALRLKTAVKNWKSLDVTDQAQALQELLETRREELMRAYPDVLSIGWGYGTVRSGKKRVPLTAKRARNFQYARTIDRELQVTFLVKRKLDPEFASQTQTKRFLPKYLFLYWPAGEERLHCAVPTDVECRSQYRFRGQSSVVATGGGKELSGALCCLVTVPQDGSTTYAVGCHHVFMLSQRLYPPPSNRMVLLDGRIRTPLGAADRFGTLWGGFRECLDAAMVRVDPALALEFAPNLPKSPDFASHFSMIPEQVTIETPGRGNVPSRVIPANRVRFWPQANQPQTYARGYRVSGPIIHKLLVELEAAGSLVTAGGDSGSPVYDANRRFLGMHIAAADNNHFLMIPASEVLRATNYGFTGLPEFFPLKVPH